jgi:serine protease Do
MSQNVKSIATILGISLFSGAVTLAGYKTFFENHGNSIVTSAPSFSRPVSLGAEGIDFTAAADKGVNAVVHVKNISMRTVYDPFALFFGNNSGGIQQPQIGTGSGVIISEDGYIVTNNHVIQDASELEVTLNSNKTFKAKVIGTDSKMDIALLKIESSDKLPFLPFADSDQVKVGEWVLAVGNPYSLNSTVTAGIISAKARNLDKTSIQSFLQTDAAVNPGNSGGALVNTRGELIGINTMISSPTGSYAGYSFAVPSNSTRKIIEDLMKFGNVQRGVIGITASELNSEASEKLGLSVTQGILVKSVSKNSGAEKAGLQKGDIITKIDNKTAKGISELTYAESSKRPNDVLNLTVLRDNKTLTLPVKLTKRELIQYEFNGIEFEELTDEDKSRFRVKTGIKIKAVNNDEYADYADALSGAYVIAIDDVLVKSMDNVSEILSRKEQGDKASYVIVARNGRRYNVIL